MKYDIVPSLHYGGTHRSTPNSAAIQQNFFVVLSSIADSECSNLRNLPIIILVLVLQKNGLEWCQNQN